MGCVYSYTPSSRPTPLWLSFRVDRIIGGVWSHRIASILSLGRVAEPYICSASALPWLHLAVKANREQSSNPCQHIFTMADKLAFLLFGDQSTDTHGFLAEFFRQPERGILANAFLEQVRHALRKEIEGLPRVERSKLPKFLTIQNLNERYHAQGLKHPGVDGALLCISQLAHYIEYVPEYEVNAGAHLQTNWAVAMLKSTTKMLSTTTTPSFSVSAPACLPQQPSPLHPHSQPLSPLLSRLS